jgi:branched-chain amino acid transport system ATP-binding protein
MIPGFGRLILVQNRGEIILKIVNMTVSYGPIIALRKVNLEIVQGEIIVLIGSNGAGKSTLLKSIIGLVRPVEGSIIYQQKNIGSWSPDNVTRSGIFLIPEDGGVFRTLTVEENLQLGAYHFFDQYKQQFKLVMHLFPILKERLKQLAGTLSGGEQRILAFSKALMSNSKLLMLDEPSIGLSPRHIEQIFKTMQELNRQGYTILLAEQNILQAFKYANRAYILENGEIVLHGHSSDLKRHPRIKQAYLGTPHIK